MAFRAQQRVIYTSPLKALSNQKYRELSEQARRPCRVLYRTVPPPPCLPAVHWRTAHTAFMCAGRLQLRCTAEAGDTAAALLKGAAAAAVLRGGGITTMVEGPASSPPLPRAVR